MKCVLKKHGFSIALAILSVVFMIACWLLAWKIKGNELVIPSLGKTLSEFFKLFGEGYFWSSLGLTVARTITAVVISFILSLICVVMGVLWQPFKAFFMPVISVFRVVPTMAVTLVLLLAFRDMTPVIVTVLVVFPMLYSQLTTAIEGIDGGLIEMSKVYKLNKRTVFSKIVFPQIAPAIVFQMGTVISFALKLTISAEVIAYVYHGLGGMIKTANFEIEIARMAALTLMSVCVGIIIELCFYIVNKCTFKWRYANEN